MHLKIHLCHGWVHSVRPPCPNHPLIYIRELPDAALDHWDQFVKLVRYCNTDDNNSLR